MCVSVSVKDEWSGGAFFLLLLLVCAYVHMCVEEGCVAFLSFSRGEGKGLFFLKQGVGG